ncbi:MAG: WXG100 family type VII secretion target [Lachnospiraceae bacterium]|nr:WXG100 family type VII secretion target [Lachnospiraceae bacterium]
MADKIKVNTRTLKKDRDDIKKDISVVRKKIDAMRQDVEQLNKMWSGEANAEFNKAFIGDIKKLENLCKMLDDIVNYETTAVTEYDTCENKVEQLVSSISV